ncbi:MAG: hypothetical protein RH862_04225 [Leptospiraceae bacterium]
MKRIEVITIVQADLNTVLESLNLSLFRKLNPPFPPVKIIRFDGTQKAGITHLSLNFLLFKQEWISENVESGYLDSGRVYQFVDEGRKLPFFLRFWRHTHRFEEIAINSTHSETRIVDSIQFQGRGLMGIFLQPILKLQFLYRKPVYRRISSGAFLSQEKELRN